MDQQAVYMEMYKECCAQGRHHEVQRTAITTVCFTFAGAAVGFIARDGQVKHEHFWLSIFLMALGALAALISYKQYERFRWAMDRAAEYRKAIDDCAPYGAAPLAPTLVGLKNAADAKHNGSYFVSHRLRLHVVWTILFLFVMVLGAWFSYLAMHSPVSPRSGILSL